MRRLFSLCFALLLGLTAGAVDRVSWEITPRVTAPGQPFRLQIIIESDVILGGAQQAGKEIRPPRGMALRLSGQIVRSDSNEATINYSGVAPDQEGEYIIPAFNLRFARKVIAVEPIKLIVSNSVTYRRSAQARAELVIPDRTFYVGELIRGSILMRGGEEEAVVASFGLESMAESFSLAVTGDRQPLPEELGQGMQTTFELTPIREGESELALNGTMLIQGATVNPFSNNGRDRPFAFRRKLTVAHVPERGRPADWSGAIGTFSQNETRLLFVIAAVIQQCGQWYTREFAAGQHAVRVLHRRHRGMSPFHCGVGTALQKVNARHRGESHQIIHREDHRRLDQAMDHQPMRIGCNIVPALMVSFKMQAIRRDDAKQRLQRGE